MSKVVVIGGGPAGAVAAMQLARANCSVLLVDRSEKTDLKIGESLPSGARPLLTHLGLLSLVESGGHIPSYGGLSCWGSNELVPMDFILDPHGLGWHLDRASFDQDLREKAIDEGVEFIFGKAQVSGQPFNWQVVVNDQHINCQWIVDATGRSALITRQFGVKRKRDDQLMALYTWVQASEEDQDSRTIVEATENGWWYTAKVPGDLRVVSLQTDAVSSAEILKTNQLWQDSLAKTLHIKKVLEKSKQQAKLKRSEASGARLAQFYGHGWLATGDAALSFDPISSQGLFNALYTGMKAGDLLAQALKGEVSALGEYGERLEKIRQAYEEKSYHYYSLEQRWPDSPFWQPRR